MIDGDFFGRDRDVTGRARNARPRDGLGRPLPYGSPDVERVPEGVVRTPTESLALAQQFLDTGRPFHAHEVLEDAWKSAVGTDRELWKALAQLAVAITHAARGNPFGAATLRARAADGLRSFAASALESRNNSVGGEPICCAIDVDGLLAWVDAGGAGVPRLSRRE